MATAKTEYDVYDRTGKRVLGTKGTRCEILSRRMKTRSVRGMKMRYDETTILFPNGERAIVLSSTLFDHEG